MLSKAELSRAEILNCWSGLGWWADLSELIWAELSWAELSWAELNSISLSILPVQLFNMFDCFRQLYSLIAMQIYYAPGTNSTQLKQIAAAAVTTRGLASVAREIDSVFCMYIAWPNRRLHNIALRQCCTRNACIVLTRKLIVYVGWQNWYWALPIQQRFARGVYHSSCLSHLWSPAIHWCALYVNDVIPLSEKFSCLSLLMIQNWCSRFSVHLHSNRLQKVTSQITLTSHAWLLAECRLSFIYHAPVAQRQVHGITGA